jgi:ABC-type antimicrobial peptide transport system permease subunit
MVKSYLKVALRNLYRNKFYSILNIVGLGVAIACCIVAYVNYEFSQSYDTFHENAGEIYTVNSYKILNNNRQNWSLIPVPMITAMKKDIPGIEKYSRISVSRGTLKYEDKVFSEIFHYADEDFFEMFTFPLKYGNKDALKDKRSIFLSEETAEKYFGDENPIGKQMALSPDGEKQFDFFVQGVVYNTPKNSSIQLSILLPFENVEELRDFDLQDWERWSRAAFVQVAANASIADIEGRLQSYTAISNETNPDREIGGFYMEPLAQLAFNSRNLRGAPFMPGMHPAALIGPSVIALLVLLLACFNFVNTAIAFSAGRLKEIGIRKVVGGVRSQLVIQFLGENLVLCFIALLAGFGLAHIFVPAYDSLWPEWSLSLNYSESIGLFLFLTALLILTAIAAGAYPAFYISRFKPVTIFRGKQKLGGTNPLIRILLTFQFALSMTAIIAGIIFNQNAEFIRTFDMGFDREQIIVVPVNGEQGYTLLKNAIENNPDIIRVAGSRHLIGSSWSSINIETEGAKAEVQAFAIGEHYFETLGLRLLDGRNFNEDFKTDVDQAALVNETWVKEFGWTSPLDKWIKVKTSDSEREYHVIGVVKDFHYNSVWGKIRPVMMQLTDMEDYRYLSAKFRSEDLKSMSQYLQGDWKQIFPDLPYDGFFQDEVQAGATQVNESIRLIFFYIALIAVFIAGMGLFALVSLNIAKRTKEIGIRKVLGATMVNIGKLISREFVILLIFAAFLAAAMGYYLVNALLASIWAYYVDFGAMPFVTAALLVFLLSILTVSSQVYRVASSNPVDAIREE